VKKGDNSVISGLREKVTELEREYHRKRRALLDAIEVFEEEANGTGGSGVQRVPPSKLREGEEATIRGAALEYAKKSGGATFTKLDVRKYIREKYPSLIEKATQAVIAGALQKLAQRKRLERVQKGNPSVYQAVKNVN
jgi:hypothetical protein